MLRQSCGVHPIVVRLVKLFQISCIVIVFGYTHKPPLSQIHRLSASLYMASGSS